MKVINLGEKNSILNKFVAQMRDKDVQKDSMRFRRNLERLGEIFAYEISQIMEAFHTVKTFRSTAQATENISTTNHDSHLHTHLSSLFYLHSIVP